MLIAKLETTGCDLSFLRKSVMYIPSHPDYVPSVYPEKKGRTIILMVFARVLAPWCDLEVHSVTAR